MNEELLEQTTEQTNNPDVITTLKEFKEKYDKLESDYKKSEEEKAQMINAFLNGQTAEVEQPKKDIQELRNKLAEALNPETGRGVDLDAAKAFIELRDEVIKQDGYDPFVPLMSTMPSGQTFEPSDKVIASGQRVADILKLCVEYADGDNKKFKSEWDRHIMPIELPERKK